MPIPKIESTTYKPSKETLQIRKILHQIHDMGYEVHESQDIIEAIENYHLDITHFDFPYGSFDNFKTMVQNDHHNTSKTNRHLTEVEEKQQNEDLKAGKICITY